MKGRVGAALLVVTLVLWSRCGRLARADPIRSSSPSSHARGAPGELPLRHAAADAENVAARADDAR